MYLVVGYRRGEFTGERSEEPSLVLVYRRTTAHRTRTHNNKEERQDGERDKKKRGQERSLKIRERRLEIASLGRREYDVCFFALPVSTEVVSGTLLNVSSNLKTLKTLILRGNSVRHFLCASSLAKWTGTGGIDHLTRFTPLRDSVFRKGALCVLEEFYDLVHAFVVLTVPGSEERGSTLRVLNVEACAQPYEPSHGLKMAIAARAMQRRPMTERLAIVDVEARIFRQELLGCLQLAAVAEPDEQLS